MCVKAIVWYNLYASNRKQQCEKKLQQTKTFKIPYTGYHQAISSVHILYHEVSSLMKHLSVNFNHGQDFKPPRVYGTFLF